tara:strand:- start:1039 stop:1533 length:495 start_codon:yes stop_codon:yes gene_type:complete
MNLNSTHKQAIQLMILDRWNPRQQSRKVANHLGVQPATVKDWRNNEDFIAEYKRQLDIYQKNFDDIKLADRKERVKELDALYHRIPEARVQLKVKVLDAIAREVGDVRDTHIHKHMVEQFGVNAPPAADNYEDWVKQNQQMEEMLQLQEAIPADAEVIEGTDEA